MLKDWFMRLTLNQKRIVFYEAVIIVMIVAVHFITSLFTSFTTSFLGYFISCELAIHGVVGFGILIRWVANKLGLD